MKLLSASVLALLALPALSAQGQDLRTFRFTAEVGFVEGGQFLPVPVSEEDLLNGTLQYDRSLPLTDGAGLFSPLGSIKLEIFKGSTPIFSSIDTAEAFVNVTDLNDPRFTVDAFDITVGGDLVPPVIGQNGIEFVDGFLNFVSSSDVLLEGNNWPDTLNLTDFDQGASLEIAAIAVSPFLTKRIEIDASIRSLTAVPEPAGISLVLLMLAGVAVVRRRS